MKNPIYTIRDSSEPFVYFHTHVVSACVLNQVVESHRSLEIDVSISNGEVYVGHPLPMYEFFNMPPPRNLPLERILAIAKREHTFLMFDCKDVAVLPAVERAVAQHGADNCVLHACVEELVFKPYPEGMIVEPHWEDEQLPVEALLQVKRRTGVPIAVCCRGLGSDMIKRLGRPAILEQLRRVAERGCDVIALSPPLGESPDARLVQELYRLGVIPLLSVDRDGALPIRIGFLGSTDHVARATDLREGERTHLSEHLAA